MVDDLRNESGIDVKALRDDESVDDLRHLESAFEHEQGLALAVFLAPREYYYPRDAMKVSRMLDTLRWR